jgi:kynureninase
MNYENSINYARFLDETDPLRGFAQEFKFPRHGGKRATYFCGNSLGLQPKSSLSSIKKELDYWANNGVEGWFSGSSPWLSMHKQVSALAAPLVGAKAEEVIVMNTLSINLHLMMVSFYRPTAKRHKIIMEGGAFPSDQYAVESQVKFHGFDPNNSIVEVHPRQGEHTLRIEDIEQVIADEGDAVALVLFSGVQYYTGQFFDLKRITQAGHKTGAKVGFDLAHAVGNVVLNLHDSGADFAVWCGYKYLNSGPGGVSGMFVHERHHSDGELPRFAGWWGHDEALRFKMEKGFIPMHGAAGWQVSTVQVLPMAMHKTSLEIFQKTSMEALREKSIKLTGYLEYLLCNHPDFKIITPANKAERGCQLSILTSKNGKQLFDKLAQNGVICDWREPNVIRLAPVPLYNGFVECWKMSKLINNYQ